MMQHKKQNHTVNKYYMHGKHAVFAAINNPKRRIEKIYCLEKIFHEYQQIFTKNKARPEMVSNDFINKKIGLNQPHQGIIAYVNSVFLDNVNNMNFTETNDKIVILDQITDPQNIGAIIRSAAAFGVNKIILPADNTPEENASIAKAASGCLELVQIAKVVNLKSAIETLKKKGFWIAGLDTQGENTPEKLKKFEKIAVIIGSEGKGMRRLTLEACDLLVKIPISENVESLNAASAASIVFYALGSVTN